MRDDPLLLVFGGRNKTEVFGDAHALHLTTGRWELWATQLAPEARAFHSAALFGERLHIFGGSNLDNFAFDSLFKIDLTKDCPIRYDDAHGGALRRQY